MVDKKILNLFEIEELEERVEFGFFGNILDGICWFGESGWDIVETAGEHISDFWNGDYFGTGDIDGEEAQGIWNDLMERWEETWGKYWGGN